MELSASFACEILLSYKRILKILVCVCVHVVCMHLCVYPYFGMDVGSDTASSIIPLLISLILIFKINILDFVLAQTIISKGLYMHMSLNYGLSQKGISCILNQQQMLNARELGVERGALRKMRGYFLLVDGATRLNRCSMKWKK